MAPNLSSPGCTPLLPDATRRLRLVLEHVTGPLKGLMQIMGCNDEPGVPQVLPAYLGNIHRREDSAEISASLIRVKRGAAYYREITEVQGLGEFDRKQR